MAYEYQEVERFMKLVYQRCKRACCKRECTTKRSVVSINKWDFREFPVILPKKSGSTLIEVIISIGIVALVLVTIVASGTLVTRNRRFSSNQGVATKYSQETIEWVKSFRNAVGWKTFYDSVSAKGLSPITVCMPLIA